MVTRIYKLTNIETFSADFALKNQIRKAAISVPSNIAEGDELGSNKQSVRHFRISRGSIAEVITQLIIARNLGYLSDDIVEKETDNYNKVAAMLNKLIQSRTNN